MIILVHVEALCKTPTETMPGTKRKQKVMAVQRTNELECRQKITVHRVPVVGVN